MSLLLTLPSGSGLPLLFFCPWCFLQIPFFVSHFLPTQDGFTLPCATLFTGLVTTLLVPLGAGMVCPHPTSLFPWLMCPSGMGMAWAHSPSPLPRFTMHPARTQRAYGERDCDAFAERVLSVRVLLRCNAMQPNMLQCAPTQCHSAPGTMRCHACLHHLLTGFVPA